MATPPTPKADDVRLSKKGLESPSQKGKVQGGFGDTKKVLILAGLGVLALGVVAYQFLGGSGPAPAKANTAAPAAPAAPATPSAATPTPAAATPATDDVDAMLAGVGHAASRDGTDGLSVERVEGLVSKFDTYVEERQIPLTGLQVNPFQVVRAPKVHPTENARARAEANAEAEAEARRQRILQAAAELKLGAVLIAGPTRSAIIAGRLYHEGDVVEGMRVAAIKRDHVTLAYQDQTVDLRLRPEMSTP
jgi:hypothetical protein